MIPAPTAPEDDPAAAIRAILARPDLDPATAALIQLALTAQTQATPLEILVESLPAQTPGNNPPRTGSNILYLLGLISCGLGLGLLHPALALLFIGAVFILSNSSTP